MNKLTEFAAHPAAVWPWPAMGLALALMTVPVMAATQTAHSSRPADAAAAAVPPELRAAISQNLRSIEPVGAGHHGALNPENRLALNFDGQGLQIAPSGKDQSWSWGLKFSGYGTPGHMQPVGKAEVVVKQRRVEYRRGAVTEWYENRPEGLEQGFTLARPPEAGAASIELRLSASGDLKAEIEKGGHGAKLRDKSGQAILGYRDLSVVDAKGKPLPAQLALAGDQLSIAVDTRGAAWPIVVDPLIVNIQQKLAAENTGGGDEVAGAYYGTSVALSGDTALVGAFRRSCAAGLECGAAYVYTRNGTAWAIQQKITAQNSNGSDDTQAGAQFGGSVVLNGDTAVVGAYGRDCAAGISCGAAYVYTRSGTAWAIQQKLLAQNTDGSDDTQGNATFGISVALSGDTALVGADSRSCTAGANCGAAYVYTRSGAAWAIQQKLLARNTDGSDDAVADAAFGNSVALNGGTALVGANWRSCSAGGYCGAAYLYTRSGAAWAIQQKLLAQNTGGSDDTEAGAGFGGSVALGGSTALAGSTGRSCTAGLNCGAAYVYTLQYALTVTASAGGTVTSNPSGIACGATCSANFAADNSVTLTATPAAGYTFTGWVGACSGSAPTCTAVMSADQTVSATFAVAPTPSPTPTPVPTAQPFPSATPSPNYTLQVEVVGAAGTVTSLPVGIYCGTVCSQQFPAGSAVYLTAVAKPGYEFAGWLDCDAIQKDLVCMMTLTGTKPKVVARFRPVSGATPSPAPGVTPAPTPVPNATPGPTTMPAPSASPAPTAAPTPVPTAAPNPTPTPAPAANQAALNVVKVGAGVVNSSAGGIDCGPVCSASYDLGSVVTLTAVPAEGYKFKRWIGGGCIGRKPCTLTLDKGTTVKVKFVKKK